MKKLYETPRLNDWGNVAQVTHVGQTRPGTDTKDGSVNPPGHN